MSPARRDELEQLLLESDDFKIPYYFFFDHFAEKEAFIRESKPDKAPELKAIINALAEGFFKKKPVPIIQFKVLNCARLGIQHGSCFLEGRLAIFFYFKRLKKGMAALVVPGSGLVNYARITAMPMTGKDLPEGFSESHFEFNPN